VVKKHRLYINYFVYSRRLSPDKCPFSKRSFATRIQPFLILRGKIISLSLTSSLVVEGLNKLRLVVKKGPYGQQGNTNRRKKNREGG
jgi:hypothetical protein